MFKHFKLDEFKCKCLKCRNSVDYVNPISLDLVGLLDKARSISNIPYVITSGHRCKAHNYAEGGVKNSSHTLGYAADIQALSSTHRFKILNALLMVGFERIGIYKSFIHADIDPTKPNSVMWLGSSQ